MSLSIPMDCSTRFFGLLQILLIGFSASSITSPHSLELSSSGGRHLLQGKKACPANFEFLNYTVITSKCKGPNYPADVCCKAFKELACPYSQLLDDLTSECATILFSYANLNGHYPPGLFANECHESRRGLECGEIAPTPSENDSPSSADSYIPSAPITVMAGFLALLA